MFDYIPGENRGKYIREIPGIILRKIIEENSWKYSANFVVKFWEIFSNILNQNYVLKYLLNHDNSLVFNSCFVSF